MGGFRKEFKVLRVRPKSVMVSGRLANLRKIHEHQDRHCLGRAGAPKWAEGRSPSRQLSVLSWPDNNLVIG
jgi:hypothetical protein